MNKRIFGFMLTVFLGALVFSGCNLDPGNNTITFTSRTDASYTRAGFAVDSLPFGMFYNQGFRLARTQ